MQQSHICFFDIDNTLWDFHMNIPESTKEAVRRLHENGHYVFLNSGRARAMIRDPRLFELGFNGVVSGMGTMIEYAKDGFAGPEVKEESVLSYHRIPTHVCKRTIETFRRYHIQPLCEGRNWLYFKEAEFEDMPGDMRKLFGDRILDIDENENRWEISKFTTIATRGDRETCFRELETEYDYVIHNEWLAEAVPEGRGAPGHPRRPHRRLRGQRERPSDAPRRRDGGRHGRRKRGGEGGGGLCDRTPP